MSDSEFSVPAPSVDAVDASTQGHVKQGQPQQRRPAAPTLPHPRGGKTSTGEEQFAPDLRPRPAGPVPAGRLRFNPEPPAHKTPLQIITTHPEMMGTHQQATLSTSAPPLAERAGLTITRWTTYRIGDDGTQTQVAVHSGAQYTLAPTAPGAYRTVCEVEVVQTLSEARRARQTAAQDGVRVDRPAPPSTLVQPPPRRVATAEIITEVYTPEAYTTRVHNQISAAFPVRSLTEQSELQPWRNRVNRELDQPGMAEVDGARNDLRGALNEPRAFPHPGGFSDRGTSPVDAIISQNDGSDVRLRLYLAVLQAGHRQHVRLVDVPVITSRAGAQDIRVYEGSGYDTSEPGGFRESLNTALDEFLQNSPYPEGLFRYELDPRQYPGCSGMLKKEKSRLERRAALAEDAATAVGVLGGLAALIGAEPVAAALELVAAGLETTSASLKAADQYNKQEDNTGAGVDALIGLMSMGSAGAALRGVGGELAKDGFGAAGTGLSATKHAAELKDNLGKNQVEASQVLAVLQDALHLGQKLSAKAPEGSVLLALSRPFTLAGKTVERVAVTREFYDQVQTALTTAGLSPDERSEALLLAGAKLFHSVLSDEDLKKRAEATKREEPAASAE